jgi:hypothetical protein
MTVEGARDDVSDVIEKLSTHWAKGTDRIALIAAGAISFYCIEFGEPITYPNEPAMGGLAFHLELRYR